MKSPAPDLLEQGAFLEDQASWILTVLSCFATAVSGFSVLAMIVLLLEIGMNHKEAALVAAGFSLPFRGKRPEANAG